MLIEYTCPEKSTCTFHQSKTVVCFLFKLKSSGGETGPFRKKYVNTIAADALAHGITKPSAAMVSIWNKHAPVIHVDLVMMSHNSSNKSVSATGIKYLDIYHLRTCHFRLAMPLTVTILNETAAATRCTHNNKSSDTSNTVPVTRRFIKSLGVN